MTLPPSLKAMNDRINESTHRILYNAAATWCIVQLNTAQKKLTKKLSVADGSSDGWYFALDGKPWGEGNNAFVLCEDMGKAELALRTAYPELVELADFLCDMQNDFGTGIGEFSSSIEPLKQGPGLTMPTSTKPEPKRVVLSDVFREIQNDTHRRLQRDVWPWLQHLLDTAQLNLTKRLSVTFTGVIAFYFDNKPWQEANCAFVYEHDESEYEAMRNKLPTLSRFVDIARQVNDKTGIWPQGQMTANLPDDGPEEERKEPRKVFCAHCGKPDHVVGAPDWFAHSLDPSDVMNAGILSEMQCTECGLSFWMPDVA